MTTVAPPRGLLAGKVAIITGASMGIGEAAAQYFAAAGASVVLAARNTDRMAAIADRIQQDGGSSTMCVAADVTKEESVERLVATAVQRFGRLDIALNNAGMNPSGPIKIEDYPMEEFRQIVDVKVMGVAYCLKHEIKAMRQSGGGAIVNQSSVVGLEGGGGLYPAASASQAAVIGLTKAAASGCAALRIRVNALAIGAVDTGWMVSMDEASKAAMAARVPIGRVGVGSDVAAQAAWLLSDHCSWITGSVLAVDGGSLA
jgi:NAD(P)-dependent dehydrogenase (short-subunit alcohol dehydrogenase family)